MAEPRTELETPPGTRRVLLQAFGLVLFAPAFAPRAVAADAPDFSAIRSPTVARMLVRQGQLVEILYFPAELGGPDDPENTGFITPAAAEVRTAAIATIGRYLEYGLADRLEVVPEHDGDSLVPNRLTMAATHSERPSAGFELTIEVW